VILGVAALVLLTGIASAILRGPVAPAEATETAGKMVGGRAMDAIGVTVRAPEETGEGPSAEPPPGA
jgi:hypothetical protein